MLSKFIQQLRKKNDYTQEDVASKLRIARATYIQIEHGGRDLSFEEAKTLADIYGISLDDFNNEKDTSASVVIEKGGEKTEQHAKEMLRISVPQKNLKKFKEVLLYILSKVGGKPNIGETVLYKLLYFIDFDFYEKYEEQLIGATYIKNRYGPTPIEFKTIVDDMTAHGEVVKIKSRYFDKTQKKYLPVRGPDLTKLKDARELQHIDEVLARLSDKNAKELSDYSHDDVPWIVATKNKPLDYEAVFYRTPKTSVRNYDEHD